MKKEAILSISFGTNDPSTSSKNLDRLEADYSESHPNLPLYRAITNRAVIASMKEKGEPSVYAVREAMARMILDGVTHLYAQPAYILNGIENDALREMVFSRSADFVSVKCGAPLLTSHEDIRQVAEAIMVPHADVQPDEGVVLIAHGSLHYSNAIYCALDYQLKDLGYKTANVGTFNAYPQIDTVIRRLQEQKVKRVRLAPFMFVAGHDAMEGVCGDAENSMNSQLKQAGFEVTAERKCLGEYDGVRQVYCRHLDVCFD